MSKGNPFLALRLSREQQDALRAIAATSGLTLSDLVRNVLADHVADQRLPEETAHAEPSLQKPAHVRRPRKPSRPVRLQGAISSLENLLADCEDWQANLPDSLQDTPTAVALAEAIDNLQQAVDLLQTINPPRGFGRD